MTTDPNTIKLLGAAQLIVFVASFISERLLASAVGSGTMTEKLVHISNNPRLLRIGNVVALFNSVAIVALAALFYVALNSQNKAIALVALGLFLAEAITVAVSKIGAYAPIPLSHRFLEAGAPEPSYFQTLGEFLYSGVDRLGYDLHMLFFCLGGLLWYYLLHVSGYVPRALSLWGLAAVGLLTVPVVLVLCRRDLTGVMILALPYAPFELVLGLWLLARGFH